MTEPTKEEMQEFIDAAFAFDAINTSSTAQSHRFSTALNKLRKEKPARVRLAYIDGDRCDVIEATQKIIARLGQTAGVDWAELFSKTKNTQEEVGLMIARTAVEDATPEINGDL